MCQTGDERMHSTVEEASAVAIADNKVETKVATTRNDFALNRKPV